MSTINVTSTAYPLTQTAAANQLPFTFNDTLIAGLPVCFAFNLNYLNELRASVGGNTIASSDINSNLYSLQSFLCDSIDGSGNFVNVHTNVLYSLSSANLNNGLLSQNLYGSTCTFRMDHWDFGQTMSQNDVLKLYKDYTLVLRPTLSSAPVTTTSTQTGDIVNNIKLTLDTLEAGPYDIEFDNIDMFNPSDFTESQLLNIYNNNPTFIGNFLLRCCYPKNYSELNALPFILFIHGQDHNSCMYDAYLNYFASYGYFAASVQREIGSSIVGSTNAYTRCGSILSHLKNHISSIAGGSFQNAIDFSKIIFIGHSLGGTDVKNFTSNYASGLTQIPAIPNFNQGTDLISVGFFEASIGGDLSGGFQNLNGPAILVGGSNNVYIGMESLGILQQYYNRPEKVIDGGVYLHLAQHENLAEPFSPVNSSSQGPQLYGANVPFMLQTSYNNGNKPTNSRTHQLLHTASQMLRLLSQYFSNNGSVNIFKNTNIQYKPNLLHDFEKTTIKYARIPVTGGMTFIDKLQNLSKLNSNASGATLIQKRPTESRTASYYSILEQIYAPNKFLSLNPPYRDNGLYVFPYNNTNISLGYTFSSSLSLNGNSFIGIPMGIIMELGTTFISGNTFLINSLSKETHQHITLELQDFSGITSWVSSKQNNMGIDIPQSYLPGYTNGLAGDQPSCNLPRMINTLYFKIADFKQLNPNLNLSGITAINILVGPSYGISGPPNGRFAYNGLFIS